MSLRRGDFPPGDSGDTPDRVLFVRQEAFLPVFVVACRELRRALRRVVVA
jgi:hypothetical protein